MMAGAAAGATRWRAGRRSPPPRRRPRVRSQPRHCCRHGARAAWRWRAARTRSRPSCGRCGCRTQRFEGGGGTARRAARGDPLVPHPAPPPSRQASVQLKLAAFDAALLAVDAAEADAAAAAGAAARNAAADAGAAAAARAARDGERLKVAADRAAAAAKRAGAAAAKAEAAAADAARSAADAAARARAEAEARAKEEAAKAEAERAKKAEAEARARAGADAAAATAAAEAAKPPPPLLCAAPAALADAEAAASALFAAQAEARPLAADPASRGARRALDKKITLTVQQVSATRRQVEAKASELVALINGLEGAGRTYALLALSARVASQCECQVALNPASAHPLAAFVATVTASHPALGPLVRARLQAATPLAVPAAPAARPRTDAALAAAGFRRTDAGAWESDDVAAARARGYVLFLGALGAAEAAGDAGARAAWTFLARLLNALPPSRLAAVALDASLEASGHALFVRYGRQFLKVGGVEGSARSRRRDWRARTRPARRPPRPHPLPLPSSWPTSTPPSCPPSRPAATPTRARRRPGCGLAYTRARSGPRPKGGRCRRQTPAPGIGRERGGGEGEGLDFLVSALRRTPRPLRAPFPLLPVPPFDAGRRAARPPVRVPARRRAPPDRSAARSACRRPPRPLRRRHGVGRRVQE